MSACVEALAERVLSGERAGLARAITWVESAKPDHRERADALLDALAPYAGAARRIGITGPPGVGKSTTIDALGMAYVEAGARVAVLAVDPSSARTGGAILGDKTRMARLAVEPAAFIRPSPTSGALGGAARATRETLTLCEAAGFSVVIVETVGVGQSETAVADMVDTFVALMLPGAGDDLQGIKKGLIELADILAVNKADGDTKPAAERAVRDLTAALGILASREDGWSPPALAMSAATPGGLAPLIDALAHHEAWAERTGALETRRAAQRTGWLKALVEDGVMRAFHGRAGVRERLAQAEQAVAAGELTPQAGARLALGLA